MKLRKIKNYILSIFALGYSRCGRCKIPWRFTKEHITQYGTDGSGCFPLCERCWKELGTPKQRWPYYSQLICQWYSCGEKNPKIRDEIRDAVFNEK